MADYLVSLVIEAVFIFIFCHSVLRISERTHSLSYANSQGISFSERSFDWVQPRVVLPLKIHPPVMHFSFQSLNPTWSQWSKQQLKAAILLQIT